jgi:TolB-like protein/DNA-binding winged helix-turn-helix (wHTH) protein/tetratricopeptide (TPR) repeat protein
VREVAPSHGVVRFSPFEVDFRKGEVRKHGFRIRLQEQPFHILQILLEHPGELITREELQRQIWPADTFVDFEKGLNNAIRKLRDALGDSAEQPRFIETQARRGYRFIGSVTATNGAGRKEDAASTGEVGPSAQSQPLYRRLVIGTVLFLAFISTLFGLDVGGVRQRWLTRVSSPVIHSLAVLPLANLSGDPAQEYFSDGMTDALITDLAQIGTLKVISRTSSMQYKQTRKSLPEIARELNVDGIVEGTVQRSGDRVRITAQLIYGPSDKHFWANSYERDMRDVFALERNVTEDIARHIQARLTTKEQTSGALHRPVNLTALDAYLQGNYHLNLEGRGSGDEEKRKAQEYFQQAINADPNFVAAYIGMVNAHDDLLLPSNDDFAMRKAAAEKAVVLDPSSSDAHLALAGVRYVDEWEWSRAEDEFRHAIAFNPSSADAHEYYCSFLDAMGRLDEGLSECQIAQQLDPNNNRLSYALEARTEFNGAIQLLLRTIESHPDDGYAHYWLSRDYDEMGKYKESVDELQQALILFDLPKPAGNLRRAFATSGYRGAMRQWANDLEHLHAANQLFLPRILADVYSNLGDKDRAFYWLEQAYEHRYVVGVSGGLAVLKVDHRLDSLHQDPRFADLLRRVGLPP